MANEVLDPEVTRRGFVNWLLGTGAAAFFLSVFYPISRYLIPPRVEESTARSVTLALKARDIKVNTGQIFRFGNRPAILIRTPAGEIRAFSAVCTHLACIVQYRADLSHIWCACHNGHFDLHGKNIAGPPPKPLEEYTVNVRTEQVIVSKKS
ncbi:MAG TPA: Rieske (2Fe-2S) protein [Candidatus Binatia bacterium]